MWGRKRSPALDRFLKSMNIGYIEWHDGLGYDLDALDRLEGKDREEAEKVLVPRAEKDWRDLEALERLGTSGALVAIVNARGSRNPEIRHRALQYGPPASAKEWEDGIVYGLEHAKSYSDGLMAIIDSAVAHPTTGVRAALWNLVRTPRREGAYHAAEALCRITGIAVENDEGQRALLLRFSGPASPARDEAAMELERLLARATP